MIQDLVVLPPATHTTSEVIRLYLNVNVSYGYICIVYKDGEEVFQILDLT